MWTTSFCVSENAADCTNQSVCPRHLSRHFRENPQAAWRFLLFSKETPNPPELTFPIFRDAFKCTCSATATKALPHPFFPTFIRHHCASLQILMMLTTLFPQCYYTNTIVLIIAYFHFYCLNYSASKWVTFPLHKMLRYQMYCQWMYRLLNSFSILYRAICSKYQSLVHHPLRLLNTLMIETNTILIIIIL